MKVIQETTEWDSEYTVPNHVYFVNDSKDKMFAYVAAGSVQVQEFKRPIKFSMSRRKFKEVENRWGYQETEVEPVEGFVKIVIGSNGEKYTITEVAGVLQCSCPGSKFRGKCRHIES